MADERRALLLGATGLVGREVLTGLLKEPAWTHVTTLGRRPTGRSSGSLEERVVPLDRMEEQAECFAAHDVFCCLRRLKPVPASVVAAAMIRAALDAPRGVTVLENEDILGLGSTRRWRDPDLPDGVIPLPPEPAGTLGR